MPDTNDKNRDPNAIEQPNAGAEYAPFAHVILEATNARAVVVLVHAGAAGHGIAVAIGRATQEDLRDLCGGLRRIAGELEDRVRSADQENGKLLVDALTLAGIPNAERFADPELHRARFGEVADALAARGFDPRPIIGLPVKDAAERITEWAMRGRGEA
jgi:hypothetical protein